MFGYHSRFSVAVVVVVVLVVVDVEAKGALPTCRLW